MESLQERFLEKYARTDLSYIRNYTNDIDWDSRLIGLRGSRGVGKTTLILQHIKKNFKANNKALYTSLDHFYFAENRLYHLAEEFARKGGQLLAIDEVHRYPEWASELKNIYDDFPDLKIIFTGSSLLQIKKAKADLSRRAVMHTMPGLSFREFLSFELKRDLPVYGLADILKYQTEIATELSREIKSFEYFENYLNYGYYPYFLESKKSFHQKLTETTLTTIEVDIPQFENMQISHIVYLKKLMQIIASSVPFKPNLQAISQRTGISINTLKAYLQYLADAELISMIYVPGKSLNSLNKPEKIYLNNTNLIFNLAENTREKGNLRETFFQNQLSKRHQVNASPVADFLIDNKYTFEIGGKGKDQLQIKNTKNAYLAKDDIVIGTGNTVPLWLFGFMY